MIRTTILSVAALCLFTGCDAYWSQPQSNTCAAKASNPSPPDEAKGVSPDTKLTWSGDESAASYDVYFGTESPPPFAHKQTETTFDPGPLDWDQTYYWKIDTVGGLQGDIWKFTTFWYGDPNAEEMNVRLHGKNTYAGFAYTNLILKILPKYGNFEDSQKERNIYDSQDYPVLACVFLINRNCRFTPRYKSKAS